MKKDGVGEGAEDGSGQTCPPRGSSPLHPAAVNTVGGVHSGSKAKPTESQTMFERLTRLSQFQVWKHNKVLSFGSPASRNMLLMRSALASDHLEKSVDFKEVAPRNMPSKSLTRAVFQLDKSPSKAAAP